VCEGCRPQSYISRHVAVNKYEEHGLVGTIIHTFKYQYAEDVFSVIERMVEQFVHRESSVFEGVDILMPVPLHKKRFAERGFNQASLIGQCVSEKTGIMFSDQALIRARDTPHQARLDRAGRLQNVADAFLLKNPALIAGKHVMLVDDVLTTGTTVQECARVLLEHGARDVSAFTLARG